MRLKPKDNTEEGIKKSDVYCYEVKSCVNDFRSGCGKNFIGDWNYLVMPKELYDKVKDEIPEYVGVYCLTDYGGLKSVKRAKRHERKKSIIEVLAMMFRCANRDRKWSDEE